MGILTKGKYTFGNKTKTEIIQLTTAQNLTGTASMAISTSTINGVGTLFTQEVFVGDIVRFSTSSQLFVVAAIVSNTQITTTFTTGVAIASQVLTIPNPKRIKPGDSVFNLTDNYPMYYAGDNLNTTFATWIKGEFCNGQVVPIINSSATASITEGQVLQNSSTKTFTIEPYTTGLDPAIAVAYQLSFGNCCVPSAVCGIHNTDASGAIIKGNFTQPNASGSNVIDDGATASADNAGIAVTASGTPVAGEVEMLVNFHERL